MECKLDKNLLQDYIEGSIDRLEYIFVREHIRTCSECRKEVNRLKLLFWELENKSNYDVIIPTELEQLKDHILEEVLNGEDKSSTVMIREIHRKRRKMSNQYLDYVPGIKSGRKIVENGILTVKSVPLVMLKKLAKGS
jgi:hypothetical protein